MKTIAEYKDTKERTVPVTARIPMSYRDFIVKNKLSLRVIICKTIDELKE